MKRPRSCCLVLTFVLGTLAVSLTADEHVAVTSFAKQEYTQRKFENGQPRTETYVFMQGQYFDGATVDHSIDKMPFRRIAEYLAPELARQQYHPTKNPAAADLLLVVHWGTTVPRIAAAEMRAQISATPDTSTSAAGIERRIAEFNETHTGVTPEASLWGSDVFAQLATNTFGDEVDRQNEFDGIDRIADQVRTQFNSGTNSRLLGYDRELSRMAKSLVSGAKEDTLRYDLKDERYFIIVRAYDLKERVAADQARKAVWTIYMNIRSPGHNFATALNLMGTAASDYFGRTTDGVQTAKVSVRPGSVTLAPVVILGEQK